MARQPLRVLFAIRSPRRVREAVPSGLLSGYESSHEVILRIVPSPMVLTPFRRGSYEGFFSWRLYD